MFAYAYIHFRLLFGVYWIFTKLQNEHNIDIKLLNYYKYQLTININKFNL